MVVIFYFDFESDFYLFIFSDDIDASGKSVNIAQFLLDVVSGNNQ